MRLSVRAISIVVCFLVASLVPAVQANAAPRVLDRSTANATLNSADSALRARLGGAYGGSWLDATTGRLTVGITNAARASEVRQAGATPRVVRHSYSALNAAQARLTRQAGHVPATVAGWYVDVVRNALVVSVVGADPAGVAFARTFGGRNVRIERVAEAPKPLWNIIGGQAIFFSGGRCSVGFNARNSAGTRYVITAGHCTNLGGNVTGIGGPIGPVAGSSFPINDYGIIRVTSAAAVSTPLVSRYSSGSNVTVAGSAVTPVGGSVCRSGSTTGWRCGTVQAFNQIVNYGLLGLVLGLTRTNVCAEPGDSGGSFVSNPGTTGRVQAQGMTSGGSGNCSSGGTTFFQPVNEALSVYGLTLYTG